MSEGSCSPYQQEEMEISEVEITLVSATRDKHDSIDERIRLVELIADRPITDQSTNWIHRNQPTKRINQTDTIDSIDYGQITDGSNDQSHSNQSVADL